MVIEVMRRHQQNYRLHAAAMLLVARLTSNRSHYVQTVLDDVSQGIFVKSIQSFRDRLDVVSPGLATRGEGGRSTGQPAVAGVAK